MTRTGAVTGRPQAARLGSGLVLALVSAVSFGMSGALARGLIDTGWSAGAIVLVRIGIAALVVLPFGLVALRGRWGLLRRNAGLITCYGVLAVAGAQFCYFSAVQHMQVGPAILIEYTAPAAVVVWLWLRHGQRPGPMTLVGCRSRGAGPGARPRPAVRRRPEPARACCGPWARWSAARPTSSSTATTRRPAADRPGLGRAGGRDDRRRAARARRA